MMLRHLVQVIHFTEGKIQRGGMQCFSDSSSHFPVTLKAEASRWLLDVVGSMPKDKVQGLNAINLMMLSHVSLLLLLSALILGL